MLERGWRHELARGAGGPWRWHAVYNMVRAEPNVELTSKSRQPYARPETDITSEIVM